MTKNYFPTLAVLLFIASVTGTSAQSFIGSTVDNYAGIQSVLINPANVADSRMRLDINLISVSTFVGNDFISIDLSDISSFEDGFDFDTDAETNPMDNNNFFGNVDVLGPSALFNLNEKSSIALTTRARAFFNIHNIGGELYEVVNSDEDVDNFNLSMNDLSGVVHGWAEFGVTYGRVVLEKDNHFLKAGATLKYLAGAGGVFGLSPMLTANYTSNNEMLTTTGNLNYGYTPGFDAEEISFSDISGGFGADLGVVYEWRDADNWDENPYKLRVGLSVTDIGAINYSGTSNYRYDMNATIDANEFDEKDLDEVLEDNYNGTETVENTKFGLPTAIQIFADYSITNRFFVSAQGAISVKKVSDIPVSNIINIFSVTPRFEMRWISVYSPISLRQYDSSVAWGFGLRAGPLTIGSGSILTNLISSSSKSVDAYVGLKIPLYKVTGY
ncbi:hypothetical protein SAMN04489724_0189 [Algoriphagus locisalis]|uniref:DUF5723 domain-containing protein n=1 Tax=Algoriphagus locisalis TaxID=305507 RepID=A0A1I7E7H8_9BACT|nr:DUF5723 family protein [Algoriphagus locisalis]SFU19753.1 hypothetical protein SAMN04489724_0189 [Algoriphagus locisalis]